MTVRELYKWAEKNNALDLDIEIYDRDGGTLLSETNDLREETVEIEDRPYGKVVTL